MAAFRTLQHACQEVMAARPERPRDAHVPEGDSLSPVAPFRVVNIGNSNPVQLSDYISAIERATGITAQRNLMPMQPGDVPATWADIQLLERLTGYTPQTSVEEGVSHFVAWYQKYVGINKIA